MPAPAIETQALHKRYGSVHALRSLDFSLEPGVIAGLIGPNGAGKTTLYGLICDYIRPTSGRCLVLGRPAGDAALKGRLAALPQDAELPRGVPVQASLTYFGRLQGMTRHEAEGAARRALEQVGLGAEGGRPPQVLSHGMGKRAALAQALLGKPELILLDEPTAGLDPVHAKQLRALITELTRELGATALISSHNLFELEQLCDHATIIREGQIYRSGAMSELTAQDTQALISLANDADGIAQVSRALKAAPEVLDLSLEGTRLRITFSQDSAGGAQTLSSLLVLAVEAGAQISGASLGKSLEQVATAE